MMKHNAFGQALFFLRRNRGVNVLIVVATALCMGCFLVMRSFGAGGAAQFASSLSSGDLTQIVVTPASSGTGLNDAAVQAFRGVEGVEAATGVIKLPLRVQVGSYEAQSIEVTAVDAGALLGRLVLSSGGMFADRAGSPQIVLGYGAQTDFENGNAPEAQSATPAPPPVNWLAQRAQVSFADADNGKGGEDGAQEPGSVRLYTGSIAGILKEDKSVRNGQAFMSLTAAKKLIQENYAEASALGVSANAYAEAYVFVRDVGGVQTAVDALAQMGYSARSVVADLASLQLELSLQQTLLTVIEIFSVVTALLSMLCIWLSARRARGTIEPLAARLIGSAALGFLGGCAAVLLACFFALITNTSSIETVVFGMRFGQSSNLAIPFEMAPGTIGISMITTLFTGWIAYKQPYGFS